MFKLYQNEWSATAVIVGFEMITYSIDEPEIVGFSELEVCMRLTVGAVGMDLTIIVDWIPGTATGRFMLSTKPFT